MTAIATRELLQEIKALYPGSSKASSVSAYVEQPWYLIAAVSFASSNRPEEVPRVLTYVLDDLDRLRGGEGSDEEFEEARKRVVLRMREAVLKGGLICGYSRVSDSFYFLLGADKSGNYVGNFSTDNAIRRHSGRVEEAGNHQVCPPEVRDATRLIEIFHFRKEDSLENLPERGEKLYTAMYGDTADGVQALLDKIHPDMGSSSPSFPVISLNILGSFFCMIRPPFQSNRIRLCL